MLIVNFQLEWQICQLGWFLRNISETDQTGQKQMVVNFKNVIWIFNWWKVKPYDSV